MTCPGRQRFDNYRHYPFQILQYFQVSEPNNRESFLLEVLSANHVFTLHQCMLAPVDLDDKTGFMADEIDNVRTDRKLPFEFCSVDLA